MGKEFKIKQKKESQMIAVKRDEFLANRMMLVLVAATLFIVSLLLLKRNVTNFEGYIIINLLPYLQIGFGVLFLGALGYFIQKRHSKTDDSGVLLSSTTLFITSCVLFLSVLLFKYILMFGVIIAVIGAVLLYFVYCVYPRDFFWHSVFTALSAILVYISARTLLGTYMDTLKIAGKVLGILVPAAVIVFMLILRRNGGIWISKSGKIRLMKAEYKYYPYLCTSVLAILGSVASMAFYSAMIYAVLALFAVYIVTAIIYTIKMM